MMDSLLRQNTHALLPGCSQSGKSCYFRKKMQFRKTGYYFFKVLHTLHNSLFLDQPREAAEESLTHDSTPVQALLWARPAGTVQDSSRGERGESSGHLLPP